MIAIVGAMVAEKKKHSLGVLAWLVFPFSEVDFCGLLFV